MKQSIELIRFLAVVLITFTHTLHEFEDGFMYFILEKMPLFGTVILSIVSGYLFFTVTSTKTNLFKKKLHSLLIPYIIANVAVMVPALVLNLFNIDVLNRLDFDYTLITEGFLSLNSPPVNPPTYFIRDLFMVFVLIEFIFRRNWKMIFIILPLLVFGKLMLRFDILFMFAFGYLFGMLGSRIPKLYQVSVSLVLCITAFIFLSDYAKYFFSIFLFVSLIDLPIKFFKTGGYTYLLHLYHAPIIVATLPVVNAFVPNVYLKVVAQILIGLAFSYIIFLITRKFKPLRVLSGGR